MYSVSRDYPVEITRARKTLWPEYKRLKQENPLSKVAIVYPAKLIMNGKLVTDMFPEWDDILRGSRIDLGHPSQHSYASKFGSTPVTSTTMANEPQRMSNGTRPNQESAVNPDSDNYMEVANEETPEPPRPEQAISDAISSNQDGASQPGASAGDVQNITSNTNTSTSGSTSSKLAAHSTGSGFKTPSSNEKALSRSLSQGRSRSKSRGGGRPPSRSTPKSGLKIGEPASGTSESPTQTVNSA